MSEVLREGVGEARPLPDLREVLPIRRGDTPGGDRPIFTASRDLGFSPPAFWGSRSEK